MLTTNKLTGETLEIDHWSDYFDSKANEYLTELSDNIFNHNFFRIKERDVEGTLLWYGMTQQEFDKSGLDYKYYETVDFKKIQNFVEVMATLSKGGGDFKKGIDLYMRELKGEWEGLVNSIGDSE